MVIIAPFTAQHVSVVITTLLGSYGKNIQNCTAGFYNYLKDAQEPPTLHRKFLQLLISKRYTIGK